METRKRTTFLTVWLIIMLIFGILSIILNFVFIALINIQPQSEIITELANTVPQWSIYLSAASTVLNIIFVISLFKWKKWALYGFIGLWIVSTIIEIVIGINVFILFSSIIGLIILIIAIKPNWKYFE